MILENRALMVSHTDELIQFNPDHHSGIIFDDYSCVNLFREAVIHILDIDNDRAIHCRYQIATIPANTKKIFTTNNLDGWIFKDELRGDRAIERRIKRHHLVACRHLGANAPSI